MNIKETPHIKINKKTGQIDYTSSRIVKYSYDKNYYVFSYNTVIGIFTPEGYYLKNYYSYSQTTASKHHPRAAAIAAYNNFKIVEVTPETINKIYADPTTTAAVTTAAIKETETKTELLKELKEEYSYLITDLLVKGLITSRRSPTSKYYKNGNSLTKYYYKTNFKHVPNIYYEENAKTSKTIIKINSREYKYNEYKTKKVNIQEA